MTQKEIRKRVRAIDKKIQKLEREKDKLQQVCEKDHSSICGPCPDCGYEIISPKHLSTPPDPGDSIEGPTYFFQS